ncbi:MAG: PLP-dependent cysteine synthase family protein [Gammaproteobacteria bacterium]|nr:PLP-dependent cysteine synthase family protein [Gammaproteobacteria bacterium]
MQPDCGEPVIPHAARRKGVFTGIGETPLVELDFLEEIPEGVRLFAKLESTNPGGSIKDRPVARMLSAALRDGHLGGDRRLLDSSSGNAGIAYAMLGAALGIPVTLVVPGNASRERLQRIGAHGAELILTDPIEGYDHALRESQRLAREQPDRYWHCDQYTNDENWRAHYHGTGAELLAQVGEAAGRAPDAFVAGVGTGGTITGAGHRLREANPGLHIACVIPEVFPGIEGLKPLGAPDDIVPAILCEELIDERIDVRMEQATPVCRRLSKAGLFVGPSSGAYVHAALKVAATGRYRVVVTILSDGGERYASTGMWDR